MQINMHFDWFATPWSHFKNLQAPLTENSGSANQRELGNSSMLAAMITYFIPGVMFMIVITNVLPKKNLRYMSKSFNIFNVGPDSCSTHKHVHMDATTNTCLSAW